MVTQTAQQCIQALRVWNPDRNWQRSENNLSSGDRAVLALRDQFIGILKDVTDYEEQQNAIGVFYALIRCHWILLNTQSGYQIARGKIDPDIYHQSGLLSALLGQLEPFLNPSDVSDMTEFLTQPIHQTEKVKSSERVNADPVHFADVNRDLVYLKREADNARVERAILETELGFSDASAVLDHIQDMKSRLAALADIQMMLGSLEGTVSLVNF